MVRPQLWKVCVCAGWLVAAGCGDGDGTSSEAADAGAEGRGAAAEGDDAAAEGDDAGAAASQDEDAGLAVVDAGDAADDAGAGATSGPCSVLFSRDDSGRIAPGTDIVEGCTANAFGTPGGPTQVNFGASDTVGDVMRMFGIDWFDAARAAGTEIDVSQPFDFQESKGVHVSYVELGPGDKAPLWVATSGSVRIAQITGSEYVVELEALKLEADGASGATGSFELNGRITAPLE